MKKLFIGLGFLIITLVGSLILSNNKNLVSADNDGWVNVGGCISNGVCGSNEGTQNQTKTTPGYTTPRVCEKTCEGVTEPFSASRTVYTGSFWGNWCPEGYTYQEKPGANNDCYKVEIFSTTITYGEKSSDPNHCHKETPVTPSIPSWASNEFNQLPQLKDKIDSNVCTGGEVIPTVVENRSISCTISAEEVEECPPTDVCPNIEGLQITIPEGYKLKNDECVEEDKIVWCHVEPNGNSQTLNLPQSALENAGHVNASGNPLHAGDHAGECEEVDPCIENPQAESCITGTPTPTPTDEPTPTQEPTPTATPSASVTPEVTGTPGPKNEHTGLYVQQLSCDEYNFKAEMEVKNGNPLEGVLVVFNYNGTQKNEYTNKDGYATANFIYTGDYTVQAVPMNGYETREGMVKKETNCKELGGMSKVTGDSRVLGANTYAKTGVFEDIMMSILGLSGATMTAVGAKLNVKKRK